MLRPLSPPSELEVDERDAGVYHSETLQDQEQDRNAAGVSPGGSAHEAVGPAGSFFEDGEEQRGQDQHEVAAGFGPSAERKRRKDAGESGIYMHDEHVVGALAATLDPSRTK